MLTDMTLKDFMELLASEKPAPGGGSAAAAAGACGVALAAMVLKLTMGKKSFKTMDTALRDDIEAGVMAAGMCLKRLKELIDEDAAAYERYLDAIRLPKDGDFGAREQAMADAAEKMIETPLETCELCTDALKHCLLAAEHGLKAAVSDAGAGARLACAGLESAALNVRINLPTLKDELKKSTYVDRMNAHLNEGNKYCQMVLKAVEKRL